MVKVVLIHFLFLKTEPKMVIIGCEQLSTLIQLGETQHSAKAWWGTTSL
jgi:hypothetical protein